MPVSFTIPCASFADSFTYFTLTGRVFLWLWWPGKVFSFFWTEHKRLVPSLHTSQVLTDPSAFPWVWGTATSGSIPPCQPWEQDALCSLRKWQFCRRSGFVKQTPFFFSFSFFSPYWGVFYSLLPPHPTLSLGWFQEQPWCHSLPSKAQRASFTNPLAVQDTKKLN